MSGRSKAPPLVLSNVHASVRTVVHASMRIVKVIHPVGPARKSTMWQRRRGGLREACRGS